MDVSNLSASKRVSMGDTWFDVAGLNHFWVRRRFGVLRRLLGKDYRPAGLVGEVGCGHGLVQAQFKNAFGVPVDGFELNQYALSRSVARDQPRFIYDIHDRKEELREKYNLMILFDVIEHIPDEAAFMESVLFHIKPGGLLAVNVPALELLRSRYDDEVGHFRRYTLGQLESLGSKCGLRRVAGSYWCLPMLPVLLLRKIFSSFKKGEMAVIESGFAPPFTSLNALLYGFCALEFLPQRLGGTSAMCVFQKP